MIFSNLLMITVRTPKQLEALNMQTYILAAIFALVFILLSIIVSNLIKYEGGSNPTDPRKRKMWFWVLGILSFVAVFLYNMLMVAPTIGANLQSKFMTANIIAAVIDFVIYVVVGVILSKMMRTKKIGNWFQSKSK